MSFVFSFSYFFTIFFVEKIEKEKKAENEIYQLNWVYDTKRWEKNLIN